MFQELTLRKSRDSCLSTPPTASNTAFFTALSPQIWIIAVASSRFLAALMKELRKLAPLRYDKEEINLKTQINKNVHVLEAYFDNNSFTVSLWPFLMAILSGVLPWTFFWSASAPLLSKVSTRCMSPISQAMCRGVNPSLSSENKAFLSFSSNTWTFLNTREECKFIKNKLYVNLQDIFT